MQASRALPLLLALLLLGACGSRPAPVTDHSQRLWQQRQATLRDFDQWRLRGRVALFVDDDVYNLGLDWVHERGDNSLTLEAALGQGMLRIRRLDDDTYQLNTAEGETRSADSAEKLLREVTGWDIPVEGLEYWIRGLPSPAAPARPEIDARGRLDTLRQNGWWIHYLDYDEPGNALPALPRRLYMKRGRVRIKIVIDQWQKVHVEPRDNDFPDFPDFPD